MFSEVIHEDDRTEDYHDREEYSVSQWKSLPHDPESFFGFHVARPALWTREETPALKFGTLVHARLIEPETFAQRYPQASPCCGVLKSGKNAGAPCGNSGAFLAEDKWYCGVHAKGTGVKPVDCLSSEDSLRLESIVRSVRSNIILSNMLDAPGEVEYALFGKHEETGLSIRGRLDKWFELDDARYIFDVKTTAVDPMNERLISAECLKRGYHWQAAAYLDLMAAHGKPCDVFAFAFLKTTPPYTACVWVLNDNDIELGRRRNRIALLDLQRRLAMNDWTGPRHGEINHLAFPAYAYEDQTHIDEPQPLEEFAEYA